MATSKKLSTPRPGTLTHFICALPYDMPEKEVLRRAIASGWVEATSSKIVYKARWSYPQLRHVAGIARRDSEAWAIWVNPHASTTLGASAANDTPDVPVQLRPRLRIQRKATDLERQLRALILRVGTDAAEQILSECRDSHMALEA